MFETIDNRADFKIYMQKYAYAHGGASRGRSREEPAEEGFVSFLVASVMRIDRENLPLCPHTTQAILLDSRHILVR